ncbi:MAG: hypothetical protein M1823_005759 [Watsoniomyces obsoletus]|nr:MAG: hypothetical protein M1823_005759 [Watsoniomyces obsoletus]
MHLSSLLPWLVAVSSVVGHPTTLVPRDTEDEGRRTNDGESGGGMGKFWTVVGGAVGTGALVAYAPRAYRWMQDQQEPRWVRNIREYQRQKPEQRGKTNHRLLREIEWTPDEQANMDKCTSTYYNLWLTLIGVSPQHPQYTTELEKTRKEAEVRCLAEAAHARWADVAAAELMLAEAKARGEMGSDRSEFSVNDVLKSVKAPDFNPAAAWAATTRSGVFNSIKAAPKGLKVFP